MPDIQSEVFKEKVFFITGNSRSGTTMMMRIMNNHSTVHSINEPHFFEKLWSPEDESEEITGAIAKELYAKLLVGQRDGFFESVDKNRHKYEEELNRVEEFAEKPLTRLSVYKMFMLREARLNGKTIPCEKTPQNVFYIKEILEHFPSARIINMIRDPRGVMLSQKRKWKRRKLGADFITPKEVVRLRINYHPITISKLWNSAVSAIQRYTDDARVKNVRFEDLVTSPEKTAAEISDFLGIEFEESMLLVPHAGSSSEADRKQELGIKKSRAKGWLEKGLNPTEIFICQGICKNLMDKYHYDPIVTKPNFVQTVWQYLILFPKLALALAMNLSRMRNIADTLKRRLSPSK
ncbi:MAG: hypothetical protein ACJAZC_000181 [Cryomorphaceae bacterium]|jgi:hypothetical protein